MDKQKQEEFNDKLQALLKEYKVELRATNNIVIVPTPEEVKAEIEPDTVTSSEDVEKETKDSK